MRRPFKSACTPSGCLLVQAFRLGTFEKCREISPNSHLQRILKPHLKPPAHPASFAFGTASRPVASRCQKRLSGGIFFAVNMRILAEYRKISASGEFKIMPQLPYVQPFLYGFFEAFSRLAIRLNVGVASLHSLFVLWKRRSGKEWEGKGGTATTAFS